MESENKFEDKDKNITLYNMDCMELLKNTEDNYYDLAIVDPPYGIGEAGEKNHSRGKLGKAKKYKNFAGNDVEPPTKEIPINRQVSSLGTSTLKPDTSDPLVCALNTTPAALVLTKHETSTCTPPKRVSETVEVIVPVAAAKAAL